jgi:uncharacterized protein (TIGR02271 family)
VQEVTEDYVLVAKGVINKEKYFIPRDLAVGYNGTILIFDISAEEAKNKFVRESPPTYSQSQLAESGTSISGDLVIVPVMAERLDIGKKTSTLDAKIIKESIIEIKTVEVPLAHDELYIETRAIDTPNEHSVNESSEDESTEDVTTLFLRDEVPEILKHHHLKEEIHVKKKISTKIEKIAEQLRSETVSVEGMAEQGEVKNDNVIV